ncbi:MAG: diguanylate cyclase [Candidatus Methylomirabilaceae bacterium]
MRPDPMLENRRGGKPRVLIVDEDIGPIRDLRALLEDRGLSVITAGTRPEALEALATRSLDLIVLNLTRPHLASSEILTASRAAGQERPPPIIAFTNGEDAREGLRVSEWGVDDLIGESADPAACAQRIEVWLRIGRLREEAQVKSRALSLLLRIAASLSRSLNLKEILEQALEQILELMEMDAGLVYLPDHGGQSIRVSVGDAMFPADLEAVGSTQFADHSGGAAFRPLRPILISDAADRRGALGDLGPLSGVGSAAVIPLVSKDRLVGTVTMFGRHARTFSFEEEELLAGLGHQVGLAIDSAGLFHETTRALARSNLLYELSNQLHSIQNFHETVQLAARQILEAFQAEGTLISLREVAHGPVTRAGILLGGRPCYEPFADPDPVARAVIDAGRPILVPRAAEAPDHMIAALLEEGVGALVAVPVQGISGCHGALALYYELPREFQPLEVETLLTYANHLGIALENARLYAASQQRADRIAAINRLTRVISSSLDIDAVYEVFAREVRQLIPYDRMGVVLPDEAGGGLRIVQLAADRAGTGERGSVWSESEGTGIAWVMSRRQPHVARDLAERRLFAEDEMLLKEGIRSSIRLPLIARGKVVGAIFLDSAAAGCYGERELELLVPLGEQLAIAIENTSLFQRINRLALTDELTGLFNRRHFYHQLGQEFKRARRYGRPLSLIMIDIDFLKRYNDQYGHLAGDQALRMLAAKLRETTRSVDILARYGGDEFGIILPETDLSRARVQGERIRTAMVGRSAGPGESGEHGKGLTISLGVACLVPHMREIEDLVREADQALYRAKAAGGNQISLA